jgi:hypothetical protein
MLTLQVARRLVMRLLKNARVIYPSVAKSGAAEATGWRCAG